MPELPDHVMPAIERLRGNIRECFLGHSEAIDRVLVCLLARGHVLIEDVPGVGKTTLATAVARSIDGSVVRLQMTPDMVPSDILGVTLWDQHKGEFTFKPGPIFCNVLVADEINRTTPRTQSALLEAMSEYQVSIDGQTRKLLEPFLVVATQNPYEFEGTYFLPESQLDRFLMRIRLGYPQPEDEARVLVADPTRTAMSGLKPVMTAEEVVRLQRLADEVTFDARFARYIVALANATRQHPRLQIGLSTRGSLALVHAAKATALLDGRTYAVPDDVLVNIVPVLAHRVVVRGRLREEDGESIEGLIQRIIESVPSPV
ncbi:AAA family ATPase [Mucisphaera sp.]|uniref:AAA family ATPase n=1 Tax=Mucisphaera sp. TaxID=2913024 RepID=UPI003D10E62C